MQKVSRATRNIILGCLVLLASWNAQARKLETSRNACPARKLKLKDCHLKLGVYKIQVWNDKIFVQDSVQRSLIDLPLKGSSTEWVEVSAQEMAGRNFLEFVAWDNPQGQGEVQSKKWFVYELARTKASLKLEKIIQRRKHVVDQKYNFDGLEKYGLSRDRKTISWYVGKEKGIVE